MKKIQSKYIEEKFFQVLMWAAVITVMAFVISIIWTICVKGFGSISWEMVTSTVSANLKRLSLAAPSSWVAKKGPKRCWRSSANCEDGVWCMAAMGK